MIDWFGRVVGDLPAEYERVIPPAGETLIFRVTGWQLGTKIVHVKPGYEPREKIAIGLSVDRLVSAPGPKKWALIGDEPVAILSSYLDSPATSDATYSIRTIGHKPAIHWIVTIDRAPVGAAKVAA